MAKIKHNNFLDTVNDVFSQARDKGILHLYAEDDFLSGRFISVSGQKMYHFGTTGYLGLEQDPRLKMAGIQAIEKYGTQFPLSKTYISHPLYRELEATMERIFGHPVVITKNSTLGHIAVIPAVVRDEDAVILDHQVHWSVQNAAELLKPRGIPVKMIRHSHMEQLEATIKELKGSVRNIWYMADGVYSMFGDFAPVDDLLGLMNKYPQFHVYFDDVHGMSWKGENGCGYVLDQLKDKVSSRILVMATMSKTFGASGSVLVCPDKNLQEKIKLYGGPLTFSAQLEPASAAAAIASGKIHCSPEIKDKQMELAEKIRYCNNLLEASDLPLIAKNESPVFYIGTGMPVTGYRFIKEIYRAGFFVNLGLFPAVPVKNTGIRFTISSHNQLEDIQRLIHSMAELLPGVLQSTETSLARIYRNFRIPFEKPVPEQSQAGESQGGDLTIEKFSDIHQLTEQQWNEHIGNGLCDYQGMKWIQNVFTRPDLPERQKLEFFYFRVKDQHGKLLLLTFFTVGIWKDDMLAPDSVSVKFEKERLNNPDYMMSRVLAMGSLFTEGRHYYAAREHEHIDRAWQLLFRELEVIQDLQQVKMIVLRDFIPGNKFAGLFQEQGFVPVAMPDSCVFDTSSISGKDFLLGLSKRNRRHFRKEVQPFLSSCQMTIIKTPDSSGIRRYYELYCNVQAGNYGLNTVAYDLEVFQAMADHPNWEFLELTLLTEEPERKKIIGVMFCYRNVCNNYIPSLIGMDYGYIHSHAVYRQLLYYSIQRGLDMAASKIELGFTASFEKRKLGARIRPVIAYIQAKDNYELEMMGISRADN